ncbi:MAG: DUF6356 family protein [Pseudomonadota bacterium]
MKLFTRHPASVGETYLQHLHSAFSFAGAMVGAGLACFIHGLLPFLFTTNGRDTVERLHRRMVTHRHRQAPQNAAPAPSRRAA